MLSSSILVAPIWLDLVPYLFFFVVVVKCLDRGRLYLGHIIMIRGRLRGWLLDWNWDHILCRPFLSRGDRLWWLSAARGNSYVDWIIEQTLILTSSIRHHVTLQVYLRSQGSPWIYSDTPPPCGLLFVSELVLIQKFSDLAVKSLVSNFGPVPYFEMSE